MATRTWIGDTSTAFETAANWSDDTLPVNGDSIVFNSSADALCVITNAQPSANAAHKFAEVTIENNFDQTFVFNHASANLKTDKLTIKAKGKITDNLGGKISFFGGGTSGVFVFFNHADMGSGPLGMFDTATSRSRLAFDFANVSAGTVIKLENGVYPNITFVGTGNNSSFSPTAVTAAGTNTYPTTDMKTFLTDSDTSVIPATKNQADLGKIFRIHGNIYAQCADFNWGNTTLEIQPQDTNGSKVPYNGNYTSSGNFRYGTAAKVFKAKYNHLRIAGLSGKYFQMDAGSILSCNKLTVLPDARFYGPDTSVNKGAEIQTIEQPTIQGDWNFAQLSDGIYRSRSNPPPNQEYHNILTNTLGTNGQVLAVSSGGGLEWSSSAGGTARTVTVDTSGNGSADNTLEASETLMLKKGTNITLSEALGVVTINATDTNTTYSVGDGGLTQNNFTNTLKSKLDGIETSADVTDATNVTAAGALMDSEVTNLAFVKGLTSGISNTNVLVANANVADNDFLKIDGTSVEGRTAAEVRSDLNVEDGATADQSNAEIRAAVEAASDSNVFTDDDHSKLNAIEASATADQTASEITALLNDVASYTLGTSSGTITIGDDLTVTGDLIVSGTTTTLNTATVEVEDNILQLNTTQGSPDTATAATSGISIYRGNGVTPASLIFDDGDDTWDLTNALTVAGTITGNLTGNVTGNVSGTAATVTGATQSAITTVGNAFTITGSNSASLNITATDGGSMPAQTTFINMTGYETRGQGIRFFDEDASGEEWFAGLRYAGGFDEYMIGYDASNGQSEYVANALLQVHKNGNVTATTFVGALTGDVTGNVSGSSGSTTGNAAGLSSTLAVASGGTGLTTIASNTILTGNGTSALTAESTFTYVTGVLEMNVGSDGSNDAANMVLDGHVTSGTNTVSEILVKNKGDSITRILTGRESADDAGFLTFSTQPDNSTGIQERMRITSDGTLEHMKNTDAIAYHGRAAIGHSGHSDYAAFGHLDTFNTGGYALLQYADGRTFLNAEAGQSIRFRIHNNDKMILTNTGNVGIGDTSPQSPLHVEQVSNTTFAASNTLQEHLLHLKTSSVTTNAFAGIAFDVSTETDADSIGASISALRDTSASSTAANHDTNLVFSTNDAGDDGNTERMRITHDGNVGIGTTAPVVPLHVSKSLATTGGSAGTTLVGSEVFRVDTVITEADGSLDTGPGFAIRLESTNDHNGPNYTKTIIGDGGGMRVKNIFGNWGFSEWWLAGNADGSKPIMSLVSGGSSSAGEAQDGILTLYSSTTNWANNTYSPTNNTSKVRLDAGGDSYFDGGDVGIGTTAPEYKLDIRGETRVIPGDGNYCLRTGSNNLDIGIWRVDHDGTANDEGESNDSNFGFALKYLGTGTGDNNALVWLADAETGTQVQAMRLTQNGHLGIGTTSSSASDSGILATLHVESADEKLALFKSTDAGAGIQIDSPNDGYSVVFFSEGGTDKWSLGKLASNSDKFSIYDEVNNTPRLVIDTSGNVGIGNTSPSSALDVTGSVEISSNLFFNGAGNHYIKHSSGTASSDSFTFRFSDNEDVMIVRGDGRVGIGTTSPDYALDIETDVSGHQANVRIKDTSSSNYNTWLELDGTGNTNVAFSESGTLKWYTGMDAGDNRYRLYASGGGNEVFTVEHAGGVGINNNSPSGVLHMKGTANNSTAGYKAHMRIDDTGTAFDAANNGGAISFGGKHNASGTSWWSKISGEKANTTEDNKAGTLRFWTRGSTGNPTQRMIINEDGEVGIGNYPFTRHGGATVSGPDATLHLVSGTGDVTLKIEADIENDTESHNPMIWMVQDGGLVSFKLGLYDSGNHAYLDWGNLTDKDLILKNNGTEKFRFTGDGKLGIGINNPSRLLHIANNGSATDNAYMRISAGNEGISGIEFGDTDDGDVGKIQYDHDGSTGMRFISGASERMRIKTDGNVGIGITSPGTSLHVADAAEVTLSVDSSHATGSQISLDATGTGGHEWRLVSAANGATGITDNTGAFGLYSINGSSNGYKLVVEGTTGNVGIGTTSPSTELHLSGADHPSIRITGTDNSNADPAFELLGTSDNFTEGGQLWYDNGTGVLHLASLYNNTNADIQFHTRVAADRSTSNVRMTIEGDGNVGINDTSPSYKLDVNGDIRAQDDMYTDKLIASQGIRSSSRASFNTMTYYYYDRQSMGTSAVYLRSVVGGSSSANPSNYAMPHAGQVMQIMFSFYGQTLATSGTDTWTIHKINTGGVTASVNMDINFANLNRIGTTNNYNILVDVSVLSDASNIDFVAGDILQIQRTDGSPIDVEHVNAQLWVTFDI